jgi:hypothetical protein
LKSFFNYFATIVLQKISWLVFATFKLLAFLHSDSCFWPIAPASCQLLPTLSVSTLPNPFSKEPKAAGYHVTIWDGRNKNGVVVASGVYVYRLQAGSLVMTKKMAVVK